MLMTETLLTPSKQLVLDVSNFVDDPLGFVYFAFPWGESDLAEHEGPDEWQKEVLEEIGLAIRSWLQNLCTKLTKNATPYATQRQKWATA